MSKILLKVNCDDDLKYPVDGFILGIDNFSFLFEKTYSIDEIKKIINSNLDKEIFVCLNRVIFNDELVFYKNILLELDKLGLKGIIVGDIAALTYNLKTNIILDQMHLNNSYNTINFYFNNGVKGIVITNDITLDEINEIKENSKAILFKQVFGYPHLSTSRRYLVTNYLNNFNINKKSDFYEIKENKSDSYYKIIEDNYGTHILGDKPLNLLGVNIDVDYKVIDGYLLSDIKDVIEDFKENKIEEKEKIDNKYNADTGFIYKETIYKVKKDEK